MRGGQLNLGGRELNRAKESQPDWFCLLFLFFSKKIKKKRREDAKRQK